MRTWNEGTCTVEGVEIHYVRTGGGGQAVVLLHGLMGSGACWTPIARVLSDELDVVMPDSRGHGRSSAPDRGYGYHDLAGDVVGLVDALALSRPVLVGHSMGGMTAAVTAPRMAANMRGLVLVDPTFIEPDHQRAVWESDVTDQHRRALGARRTDLLADVRARHPHRASEILELQVDARLSTSMSAMEVLAPPNPDFRDVVRAVHVPTLLVIGDAPVVPLELATELSRINPRVRVEQIPNAGHGLPFDQPDALTASVASFIRSLP